MNINSLKNIFKLVSLAVISLVLSNSKSIAKENLSRHKLFLAESANKKSDISFFQHNNTSSKKSSVSTPFSLRKKGREENNDVIIIKNRECSPFEYNVSKKVTDYKKDFSHCFVFLPSLRGPPIVE